MMEMEVKYDIEVGVRVGVGWVVVLVGGITRR